MSDFFGTLARRAMAPAGVRPRVASRFESGSGVGLNERHEQVEAVASAPEAPPAEGSPKLAVSPLRPAPDVAFDPALVRERVETLRIVPVSPRDVPPEPQPEARSERLAEVPPLTVPPAQRRARAAAKNPAIEGSPPGRTPQSLPPVVPLAPLPHATERIAHERTEHQTVRSLIESRVVERLTAEPRPPGKSSRAPTTAIASTQAPAPAAPRVEIHIGRIEVMPAAAPPNEPQRVEAPRPFPAQSLDAYLTERSSRRRS